MAEPTKDGDLYQGGGYAEHVAGYRTRVIPVGIHGKAGSGKDTLADAVIKHNEKNPDGNSLTFCRQSFADPIKKLVEAKYGLVEPRTREGKEGILPDQEKYRGGLFDKWVGQVSYRKILQLEGTELGRAIYDDFWVDRLKESVRRNATGSSVAGSSHLFVLIPDTRFDNEAAWIRKVGGILVHVIRPGQGEIVASNHASEAGLKGVPFDLTIWNDSDFYNLETYAAMVHTICRLKLRRK